MKWIAEDNNNCHLSLMLLLSLICAVFPVISGHLASFLHLPASFSPHKEQHLQSASAPAPGTQNLFKKVLCYGFLWLSSPFFVRVIISDSIQKGYKQKSLQNCMFMINIIIPSKGRWGRRLVTWFVTFSIFAFGSFIKLGMFNWVIVY